MKPAVSVLVFLLMIMAPQGRADTLTVASKNFTESYLLAEIATQLLNARGIDATHRRGLGGTKFCFDALVAGDADLYPEYSGTIRQAILGGAAPDDVTKLLAERGLEATDPLGFNNTYVLALRKQVAEQHGIWRISDLRTSKAIRIALSHEFLAREDGWPALAQHYGLSIAVTGIEHGLAYKALAAGEIDLTDAYSTDGELQSSSLTLLDDDRQFFPRYDALWLIRNDLPEPARQVLAALSGKLDETTMQRLNGKATVERLRIDDVAATFLLESGLIETPHHTSNSRWQSILRNTLEHIAMTAGAVAAAAVAGILVALLIVPHKAVTAYLLGVCSLLQTIPSMALLALMIPLFGIGIVPAMIALFLYALLPIVRATITALLSIDPVYLFVADALGMDASQRRRYVLIPLAVPHILAGLRTAVIISIGTATLAAFIGAGGLGEPIVTGLALNNTQLVLQGAIPAALLAIVADLAFNAIERRLLPAHLRQQ